MSQIYSKVDTSPPPIVATTYQADTGTATPAANILNVLGDENITTSASGNTIIISPTDTVSGTGQTIGAVTDDVITFPLGAVAGTYQVEGSVAAYEAGTPSGGGIRAFVAVRTDGATATICNSSDPIKNLEVTLNDASAEFVVSGNDLILRVTGVTALTIEWAGRLFYTFVGA